jgi:hypothetical protein
MAGKFLKRAAIIDTIKSEHRTNAMRRREGLIRHPIRCCPCGCPDENCGAFHGIDTMVLIPTTAECAALLADDNRIRKPVRPFCRSSARPHWGPLRG